MPIEDGQISLAPEPAGFFNNPNPSWGMRRAMAISADGAYSVVWSYETPADARAGALSDCEEFRISDLEDLDAMPCIIVPFK